MRLSKSFTLAHGTVPRRPVGTVTIEADEPVLNAVSDGLLTVLREANLYLEADIEKQTTFNALDGSFNAFTYANGWAQVRRASDLQGGAP